MNLTSEQKTDRKRILSVQKELTWKRVRPGSFFFVKQGLFRTKSVCHIHTYQLSKILSQLHITTVNLESEVYIIQSVFALASTLPHFRFHCFNYTAFFLQYRPKINKMFLCMSTKHLKRSTTTKVQSKYKMPWPWGTKTSSMSTVLQTAPELLLVPLSHLSTPITINLIRKIARVKMKNDII